MGNVIVSFYAFCGYMCCAKERNKEASFYRKLSGNKWLYLDLIRIGPGCNR